MQNIAISNCLLYEVDGCPMKFQGDPGSSLRERLVLKPGAAGRYRALSASALAEGSAADDKAPVIARNISVHQYPRHRDHESRSAFGGVGDQ